MTSKPSRNAFQIELVYHYCQQLVRVVFTSEGYTLLCLS